MKKNYALLATFVFILSSPAGVCQSTNSPQDKPPAESGPAKSSEPAKPTPSETAKSSAEVDLKTGQMSLCSRRGVGWACVTVPDDRAAFDGEIARLQGENAALKKGASTGIRMKVSEKGAVSIYGMGRFPVTLYKEQWVKLLDMADDIRAFIAANESQLKAKE